jgi:viologen exporter family transport system permease protein
MKRLGSYLAILRGSLMVGVIYRFGFIFNILGNIIYMTVVYFLWRSIYSNATTLRGLTFHETFLYVALGSAVFILLKTYADWLISFEIREGMIAIYLTKPVDYQLYSLANSLGGMLMNLAAITVPTVVMLVFVFRVPLQLGPGLLLFPFSLALAFLLSFNFDYFIGILGFYSESIWGMSITKEMFITVLSGALIPLQFFPDWLQRILLRLPFQAIYHTPLMMITRPNQDLNALLSMLGIQVVWVVVAFILTRLFYNQAVKVLRVAGG